MRCQHKDLGGMSVLDQPLRCPLGVTRDPLHRRTQSGFLQGLAGPRPVPRVTCRTEAARATCRGAVVIERMGCTSNPCLLPLPISDLQPGNRDRHGFFAPPPPTENEESHLYNVAFARNPKPSPVGFASAHDAAQRPHLQQRRRGPDP